MSTADLKERTTTYAVRVLTLFRTLPKTREAGILGAQLLRSDSSVGANYREALRARSNAEYISKIGQVLRELDESHYWFELLVAGDIMPVRRLEPLLDETNQLLAICVSLSKKAGNPHRIRAS